MLVGTTYEGGNGKGKKAKTNRQTFWCIRADVVRKLGAANPNRKLLVALPPAKAVLCGALANPRFVTWWTKGDSNPVWSKNSSPVAPPTKNSLLGGL